MIIFNKKCIVVYWVLYSEIKKMNDIHTLQTLSMPIPSQLAAFEIE